MIDLSKIPIPLLFVISVLSITTTNTLKANFAKKEKPATSTIYFLNGGLSLMALLVLFAYAGFKLEFSTFTLITAVIFGVVTMLYHSCTTLAVRVGPYSYTTVIASLSTIITALSGWVYWGEKLSIFKVIGLVFIIACFILAVDRKKDNKSKNLVWFILCMVCLVASASIGLTQKVHQSSEFKLELDSFLCIGFIIYTIGAFTIGFILKNKETKNIKLSGGVASKLNIKLIAIYSLISGTTLAFANIINLYLSGAVESAIMFPIANGVPFVLAILLSFVLFKEKLDKRQTLGVVSGIISMVFLCL